MSLQCRSVAAGLPLFSRRHVRTYKKSRVNSFAAAGTGFIFFYWFYRFCFHEYKAAIAMTAMQMI